ncbi:helix-turn-helix domain-containing protein [Rathayibacter sp. VKM Ac-2630]|uniref:helix-turn-helix domain-containing protein n=1 Tax=Rathayibacter sp. VKM Ac-2630 TaxID=1938617 RepID=UPI000980A580|nr:helix-turn-helix transcriptional regulator [Rathayibacter sp. VKM Ac-2630]OOB91219.1 hypothetical protein B0T42_07425 [Rathayibacter sp. VKM Ac-2630]
MARNLFDNLTEAERDQWAAQVKELRHKAGLTQAELAAEAKTSRATINNLEKGVTPQSATLKRVLEALGIDMESVEFQQQTQRWLTTMGTLIEAIPEKRRSHHVDLAIGTLAAGIKETNVTPFPTNVGGTPDYEADEYQAVASDMEGGPEEDE